MMAPPGRHSHSTSTKVKAAFLKKGWPGGAGGAAGGAAAASAAGAWLGGGKGTLSKGVGAGGGHKPHFR